MKNEKYFFMIGAVASMTFVSCNNSEELTNEVVQVQTTQEDNLIERNILNLSSVDASKLTKQFSKNEYGNESRSASDINVKDIQTVTSESGEPLMYVVNYANNKGYTIISATKNYTPVLAYSETGYFDTKDKSFSENILIDEYKAHLKSVVNLECDSLRRRYALSWSSYEKDPEIQSRTYTDSEIQQKLSEARTYYGNLGYEVHSLGAATYLIPAAGGQTAEERANGFVADICEHTPSQYDCMDVTLLLVKRYNTEECGPYLQTAWHQGIPYSVNTPYQTAGCIKIAVTQLMYYYSHPDTFNWSNIRLDWGSYLAEVTTDEIILMKKIGEELNLEYPGPNKTKISIPHMITTFQNNGYEITEMNYNYDTAKSYVKSGIPLIMYGRKKDDSEFVHVWICDGFKIPKVQYAAYMIDRDFEDYIFFSGMTDSSGDYFHLNMGDGNNMWYYQDIPIYDGDYYTDDRKMYVITKKS